MTFLSLLQGSNLFLLVAAGIIIGLCFWLYRLAFVTDIPKLENITEIPGAIPFYGHLKTLGGDHASVFEEYATKHNVPVVQAKLGNR